MDQSLIDDYSTTTARSESRGANRAAAQRPSFPCGDYSSLSSVRAGIVSRGASVTIQAVLCAFDQLDQPDQRYILRLVRAINGARHG